MVEWKPVRIGDLLIRSKIGIDIEDSQKYKRVTIRIKHQGVSIRDEEIGKKIGTKKQFLLKSGQFVMSKIDARYGAFGIANDEVDNAIITGNFWAYDINKNLATVEWINNYTNSPEFYDLCERASSGITHRKYLNEKVFLDHQLLIPSAEKQQMILMSLDKRKESILNIDAEISSQKKHISLICQSILQDAIEGKLTEAWRKRNSVRSGDPETDAMALIEKIKKDKQQLIAEGKIKKAKPLEPIKSEELSFELPEGWVWTRLGEISDIAGGLQKTPLRAPKENFYPYLAVQNVQRGYLNINEYGFFEASKGEFEKLRLQEADLLLIEGNGSINEIGRCAIWNNEIIDCIHQNHVIRARMINLEMPFFIIKVLNSQFGISQMQNKARTTTGLFNLGVGKLSQVLIPLPPLGEQRAIVEQVDRLLAMVDALKEQVVRRKMQAEELMQTVLREAFES